MEVNCYGKSSRIPSSVSKQLKKIHGRKPHVFLLFWFWAVASVTLRPSGGEEFNTLYALGQLLLSRLLCTWAVPMTWHRDTLPSFLFLFFIFRTGSCKAWHLLCRVGGFPSCDPPASASQMRGFHVHTSSSLQLFCQMGWCKCNHSPRCWLTLKMSLEAVDVRGVCSPVGETGNVGGYFVPRAGVYCCVAENPSAGFMGHCFFSSFIWLFVGLCFCFCFCFSDRVFVALELQTRLALICLPVPCW